MSWKDRDTLLVGTAAAADGSTDTAAGGMTDSGYPRTVRGPTKKEEGASKACAPVARRALCRKAFLSCAHRSMAHGLGACCVASGDRGGRGGGGLYFLFTYVGAHLSPLFVVLALLV